METPKSENRKAYLIPYPIETFSKPIAIKDHQTYIGRHQTEGNQIQIDDRHVSRRHACIHSEGDRFFIEDLGSQNGTFLNSERIRKASLNSHDRVTIGNLTYLFLSQADSTHELQTATTPDASNKLAISMEEIDLSAVCAQNAEKAARLFLHPGADLSPDLPLKEPSAHTRLALLYRLSDNLRATSNAEGVYDKGVELIMEAIPAAEYALVAKRSGPTNAFSILSFRSGDQRQGNDDSIPISRTVFDWVLTEKVTLVSENLGEDQRFLESESIRIHDLRSIVCAPICGKDRVLGLLYAQSNNLLNPFTKDDAQFVSAVANEMALNIDNIRMQKQMLRNERMAAIGLTVSNLAHNIKNLLAVQSGASQLMDNHIIEKDYPQIAKKWQWIKDSLAGISKLSIEMLEFVKEDELHIQPVDVNHLIRSNRQLFEGSISRNGLTFAYALTEKKAVLATDAMLFQQALLNLVLNAVDALKEKDAGRVLISTDVHRDGFLDVSVADNGCGIPASQTSKVLDLFYTTKGSKGTGLGLPMVQKFVEKSGGKLKFQSEAEKGSTFTMVFPLTPFGGVDL